MSKGIELFTCKSCGVDQPTTLYNSNKGVCNHCVGKHSKEAADKEANQKLNMIVDQKGKANVSQKESIALKAELEIKRAHATEKQ